MEYFKYGDLRKYIKNSDRAPLTENDIRLITLQLLEGLDVMHSMKERFSHRDIKPEVSEGRLLGSPSPITRNCEVKSKFNQKRR
jgi:serine/threonine protein kinase